MYLYIQILIMHLLLSMFLVHKITLVPYHCLVHQKLNFLILNFKIIFYLLLFIY